MTISKKKLAEIFAGRIDAEVQSMRIEGDTAYFSSVPIAVKRSGNFAFVTSDAGSRDFNRAVGLARRALEDNGWVVFALSFDKLLPVYNVEKVAQALRDMPIADLAARAGRKP